MKKILIIGGAGYVGSALVPKLLSQDYKVIVFDLFIYGEDVLEKHKNLEIIKGDIRDINLINKYVDNVNVVIHLACISNDASFVLDEDLSTSVNLNAFEPIVLAAKKSGIKRFD